MKQLYSLLYALLFIIGVAAAQNGNTCVEAKDIPQIPDSCAVNEHQLNAGQHQQWHKINPQQPELNIKVEKPLNNQLQEADIKKISLYKGGCGGLQFVEKKEVALNESLEIIRNDITAGEEHFIKIERDPGQGEAFYGLCVKKEIDLNSPSIVINCEEHPFPTGPYSCNTDIINVSATTCAGVPLSFCHSCSNIEFLNTNSTVYSCFGSQIEGIPGNAGIYMEWNFTGSDLVNNAANTSPYIDNAGNDAVFTVPPALKCYDVIWNNPGTYNVTVQLSGPIGACYIPSTWNVEVTVLPVPSSVISSTNPYFAICPGESLTLQVQTCSFCNYEWLPGGQTSSSITVNQPGTYTATVYGDAYYNYCVSDIDFLQCSSASSITVTASDLAVAAAQTSATCQGENDAAITASATGGTPPYNFLWSNGQNGSIATGLSAGTYSVTVTDDNGCTASATVSITSLPLPNVTVSVNTYICSGETVTLSASGGVSYLWAPAAGLDCPACQVVSASPVQTTTYTVTATGANGCSNTASVTVFVDEPVTPGILVPLTPICVGEQVCLHAGLSIGASDNPVYSWNFGSNANPPTSTSTTSTAGCTSFLTAGSHSVSFTVTNQCGSFTATQNVNVNGNPIVDLGADKTVCEGSTINIAPVNVSSNVILEWNYQYSGQSTVNNNVGSSVNVLGNSMDYFNVTVTAVNNTGCQSTDELHVDIIHPPVATASANTICQGGSATLLAVGGSSGFNYAWFEGSTLVGIGQSLMVTPTAQITTYKLVALSSSCVFNDAVTVNLSAPPAVSLSQSHSLCNPSVVTASVSGGTPPFSYIWPGQAPNSSNTYSVSQPVSSLGLSWTFNITVTDAVGCTVASPYISVTSDPFYGAFFPSFPNLVDISIDDWKVTDSRGAYYSGQEEYNATVYFLQIRNKWNNPIWDASGINSWGFTGFFGDPIRWDGHKYNGKLVNDGDYPFILTLWNCGNTQNYTGWAKIRGGQLKVCSPPDNTPQSNIHYEKTLAGSATWSNSDQYVNGIIKIPSGKTLNIISSNVYFSEGAKMVVEPGGKLSIINSGLSSCSNGYLWEGIEVRGNKMQAHTPNKQGMVDVKNSTIRDAGVGIFAGKIDDVTGILDPGGAGGIVKISNNSQMLNNGMDIYLMEYSRKNNLNEIKQTIFGAPSSLFGSAEVPHILIEGAQGLKLHDNSFTKGDRGIQLKKVKDIELYNSNFNFLTASIKADSSEQLAIRDNIFNEGLYGIQLTYCFGFSISDNEFNGTKIPVSTKDSREGGISEIKKNKFNRPEKAIHFENDHHTNLDIVCNEFNQFTQYAIESDHTLLKSQGTQTEGAGNIFVSSSTLANSHLKHSGPAIEYYYDPADAASFSNSNIMSANITKVQSGNDRNCNKKTARLSSSGQTNDELFCFTAIRNNTEYAKSSGNCPTYSLCDSASLRNSYLPVSNLATKYFKIRWNIFRDDAGTNGLDTSLIQYNMNVINNNFASSGFQFLIDTVVFINNSNYNNDLILNDTQSDSIMKVTYGGNYDKIINVYVIKFFQPQVEGANARLPYKSGISSGGTSVTNGIVITQGYLQSPYAERKEVITHELGHIFGLLHTFEGTNMESCAGCREIPDGSGNSINGDVAGDFISDTPAMPWGDDCTDGNSKLDTCSGNYYLNMPYNNYMGYNYSTTLCLNEFTPQQAARMHCMAEHHLANWIIPVGTEELYLSDFNFEVFPNPANDKLQISGNFSLPATVELLEITGKKVMEQTLKNNIEVIDTKNLSQGFYLLRISTKKGNRVYKIVKE